MWLLIVIYSPMIFLKMPSVWHTHSLEDTLRVTKRWKSLVVILSTGLRGW